MLPSIRFSVNIESDFALAKLFVYIVIGIIFLNINKFKKILRLNICVME